MKKLFSLTNLWILVVCVTLTGLFLPPLMGNDAPEYATIALRMHRDHDYVNIINRDYDYLDKPHILFWSASLGYTLFGVHDWSYRLISVVVCFAGAFATYRLGTVLYNKTVGHIAALMFIAAQAIILGNHDVRTDALLTGLVIISIGQFVEYIERKKLFSMLIAAAALGLAVGTKGMIAVLVTGCCLFFYLLSQRKWDELLDWKWLAGLGVFLLSLSPVLYCYYLQFDLHPEKFVNNAYGTSGVEFLLWTQSFERLAATHERGAMNPEFLFLHHNFLWSFLPWTLLALAACFERIKDFFVTGYRALFTREQLTFLAPLIMFTFMSLSKFKLPHYMNVLFPMIAIATAAFLFNCIKSKSFFWRRYCIISQDIILVLIIAATLLLNVWAFSLEHWTLAVIAAIFLVLIMLSLRYGKRKLLQKFWVPSLIAILGFNFLMHTNIYPQLGQYQAGSSLAVKSKQAEINYQKVYTFNYIFRSFDFYSGVITPQINLQEVRKKIQDGGQFYLLVNERGRTDLLKNSIGFRERFKTPDIPITRLKLKFLNPETREETLKYAYLLEFN